MDEYQGLGAKEVNFMSLLFYWMERWRWIVFSMLFFAILTGGYKYYTAIGQQSGTQEVISEYPQTEKSLYEEVIEKKEFNLKQQEEYLNSSAVMQMDAHHVATGTLTYHMECEERQESLFAAYIAYISGGELAEQLHMAAADLSMEDLQYLISFIGNNNDKNTKGIDLTDDIDLDDIGHGSIVFQIQVRMPDSNLCETYLDHVQKLIMEYSSHLQTQVGEHQLTLLFSGQAEMTDQELKKYQSDVWTAYMNSVSELEKLQTQIPSTGNSAIVETINPKLSAMKYAVLGLVLGVFFACFVLMLLYLFGGKLQDTQNFNLEFGIPLLGVIRVSGAKKKLFGFIDTWIFNMREQSYAKISMEEQIKMAAVNVQSAILRYSGNQEPKRIMFSGTVPEKELKVLYAKLTGEMCVACSPYMQIVSQSSALKKLDEYDAVLFLEKRGVSQSSLIVQEKKLASDRGVKILGAIIVC